MTMDLMYGCGSEYDLSLEDLLEVDLKAEMDRIVAASANGHPFEFMAEFEFTASHFRLPYDDDRFDDLMMEKHDPLSWALNNNSPIKKEPPEVTKAPTTTKQQPQRVPSPHVKTIGKIVNGINGKKVVITNGVVKNGPNGKPHLLTKNAGINGAASKNGIKNGHKNYNNNISKVNNNNASSPNNVTVNAKILASKTLTNGKSINRAVVASVGGSLSMSAFANEDSLGKWVDPSTILPASVSSTSSVSESESDVPTEFPTDDESESEAGQQTNTIWIVPTRKRLLTSGSSSTSPNDLHEYELDEPEFIITDGGTLEEAQQPKKKKQKHEPLPHTDGKIYPKPGFSYSCLIAMSLKNSKTGSLPVSEIYKFMCDHFPYFKSAPSGWKNSVRHNLSLNKCFEKIEKPGNNGARKGCLWALNPAKIHKMDEEVQKWTKKDPMSIKKAMSDPENLELLERGELKRDYSGAGSDDDEDEEEAGHNSSASSRQRGSSTDSMGAETIMSTTTPTTKISQVHSVSLSRPTEQKIHVKSEPRDSIDLSTIANVQGNLICQPGTGPGTYTLSFSTMNNTSTTPIIIRRTTVK